MADPRIKTDTIAEDFLWGSKQIERYLGCSPRHVKTLLKNDFAPVHNRAGRIVASKAQLLAYYFGSKTSGTDAK